MSADQNLAHLVQSQSHGREVIEEGQDDHSPCGHLQVQNDNSEKEEEDDEKRAGNPVDDISLQAAEDFAAVHNGRDDGGYALFGQDDVSSSLGGPCTTDHKTSSGALLTRETQGSVQQGHTTPVRSQIEIWDAHVACPPSGALHQKGSNCRVLPPLAFDWAVCWCFQGAQAISQACRMHHLWGAISEVQGTRQGQVSLF